MRKLSQKELLDEGIGSALAGIGRVAGKALGGAAKALAPQTAAALGKGASLAAGAIENIKSGSATGQVKKFLNSEEGRRQFKGGKVKFGKEEVLPNNDIKIPVLSGIFLNDRGGGNIEEKDLTSGYFIVRQTERPGGNGYDNSIREIYDRNGKLNTKPTNIGTSTPEQPTQQQAQPAQQQAQPAQEEPQAEEPATEEPAQEEPTAEPAAEPAQEEPAQEEPQAEEPATDKLATPSFDAKQSQEAFSALKVPGFKRDRQDMEAIKSLKKYLETQTGKNHPDQTLADRLRSSTNKGRVSIKGVNFNRDALRKILESKNSQKNLLKLLHSGSRMNKWVIGR